MWAESTASLRHRLIGHDWESETICGVDLAVNRTTGIAIAVTAGDRSTGFPDYVPQARYERREVMQRLVNGELDNLWTAAAGLRPEWETWFLLHYLTPQDVRTELSKPINIDRRGWVTGWSERILVSSAESGGRRTAAIALRGPVEAFDFNPARLTLARRRRGLTKVALGHKLQLTARRLAAFENEGQTPPESTIAAIAEALDFPIGFFARETPPSVTDDVVSFRSFSRLSATNRDAALAAAALAIELAAWIDERFRLPKPQLPDVRDVEPKTAAVALRVAWGLGDAPAPNLIHLLEAHGVRVFSLTDDCADLDAFSLWSNGVSFVFLTRHKSPERGRWDAAHELGHLVLHLGSPPQGREQENEADEFAREFLLPQGGVLASAPRYASLAEIRVQKIVWRVSALAYIRRLHQLGLVSDWHYRSLAIAASEAGYRRAEGDIERESSQLISKVFAMLREDGVTAANVAADLAIPLADLRSLLFFPLSLVEGGRTGSRTSADAPRLRVL